MLTLRRPRVIVASIRISLPGSGVEHLVIGLLAICKPPLEKCLLNPAHFSTELFLILTIDS